ASEFKKALVVLETLFTDKWMIKEISDRSLVYLLLARSLNRNGNFDRTLLVLSPIPVDFVIGRRADLLYERGWAALQNGNFKWAANDFSAYLEIVRESDVNTLVIQNAELNRAEALFNLHQDQETAELLTRFVARWPQSSFLPRVRNYQGLLALRRGEFEAAEAIFSDLASPEMNLDVKLEAEVLYNRGESLFSLEKYAAAITVYQKLVDKYPQLKLSGKALIRMGESYFNQANYLKSQLVYLKAKQLWPGGEIDEKASYGMLLLAYNQDKFSYLEAEVKSFIKRFPDSSYTVPLMLLLVDLYQRQGREGELIALLKELEQGDYADDLKLEAFYRHFKFDLKNGSRVAAHKDCQRLLEHFPLSKYECDCRLYLSQAAFLENKFKAALTILEVLPEAGCPDPDLKREVILLKARIYQQLGSFSKARNLYLIVAESRQSSNAQTFLAFSGLGDIFVHEKEFDEALFFYDKAMRNPVKTLAAGAALKRAATLEAAGQVGLARKSYLRISYIYPEQDKVVGDALLNALRLARQEKDEETAKKMVEKLGSVKLDKAQRNEYEKLMVK
ncbi:MAG: tetratricopeptide repeat protein, partial [Deltaproteobacteria bacterium]|nr:tetratricopeptide repeat protein [Deltaproteobacteria bacterium]